MKITDAPALITTPFAQNGSRNDIPATATGLDTGRASFTTGFPDETMKPITAGGVPPFGKDFNGILYALTNAARFYGAGGHYKFNADFAAAIGGYPMGATVQASDNMGHWLNVVESNNTDPESALSTGWLPLADHNGTATANLAGNASLTALQAAKANLRFTGTLTGNVTVTFPAWTKRYSIINDCTGDQSIICTTGNGESISIKNGAKYEIGCDGKNLTVATVNASQVFAEPNKNVSALDAPTVQQIINTLGNAATRDIADFDPAGAAKAVKDALGTAAYSQLLIVDNIKDVPYDNSKVVTAGAVASLRDDSWNKFAQLKQGAHANIYDRDYGVSYKDLPYSGITDVPSTGAMHNILTKFENDIKDSLGQAANKGFFDTGDPEKIPYGGAQAASTGCVAAVYSVLKSVGYVNSTGPDTGWVRTPSGTIFQFVKGDWQSPGNGQNIKFPIPFPNTCFSSMVSTLCDVKGIDGDAWYQALRWDRFGTTLYGQATGAASNNICPVVWAIGY